jgi:hypothetical protein
MQRSPAAVFFFKGIMGSFYGILNKVLAAGSRMAKAYEPWRGDRFYEA